MVDEKKRVLKELRDAVAGFDLEGIRKVAEEAIRIGLTPYEAVLEGMSKGMEIVGKKYEKGEYFLSELIIAGETMKEGFKVLKPHMVKGQGRPVAKAVIGTVQGDLHDIGKNIVATLLTAAGFDVKDLGVDVFPDAFVEAVREEDADILAMSALLTVTMNHMKDVIDELRRAGLRDRVKVIVGGAPLTKKFAEMIGADGYAKDAVEGVEICKGWVKEKLR